MPDSLIEDFFTIDCSTITDWDNFDLPTFIAGKSGRHANEVKSILNGCLAKKIKRQHLEDLNAFDEIKGWFTKMRELYQ